jgi:hypothetical protein
MRRRNNSNFQKWYVHFELPQYALLAAAYPNWPIETYISGKQTLTCTSEMTAFGRLLDLEKDLIDLGWKKITLVGDFSIKIEVSENCLIGNLPLALRSNSGAHVISGGKSMRIIAVPQLTTTDVIFEQLLGRFNRTEEKNWLYKGFSLQTLRRKIKQMQKTVEQQIGGSVAAFELITSQINK